MKQTTLYVTGMHCAACELLIEKKLLQLDTITGVDVSLAGGRVVIHTKSTFGYSIEELNKHVQDLGYTFSGQKPATNKQSIGPVLYYAEGKGIQFDRAAFAARYEWLIVFVVLVLGWKLISALEVGQYMNANGPESLVGIFVLGIIASLSSCAALIGGLLLSLTKQWHEQTLLAPSTKKASPHVQFHIGRILGFGVFGGVLGLLGDVITFDNITVYAGLVLAVSVVMVILALQMLGLRAANSIRLRLPAGIANNVLEHPKRGPFLIGAGTFFLPCGFTLIVQAVALASGTFLSGFFIMAMFAVGTLPVLLGISVFGLKMNSKPHMTARFNKYAGIVVLLFALYNINGQLNVLGLPSLSDLRVEQQGTSQQVGTIQTTPDGEQIVSILAKGFSYTPTGPMTIEAGKPTVLVVDDQGIQGCGVFLAVAGLMDGYVSLQPGSNTIDLGTPQAGTYKITCSMGMVPPVTLRVI